MDLAYIASQPLKSYDVPTVVAIKATDRDIEAARSVINRAMAYFKALGNQFNQRYSRLLSELNGKRFDGESLSDLLEEELQNQGYDESFAASVADFPDVLTAVLDFLDAQTPE